MSGLEWILIGILGGLGVLALDWGLGRLGGHDDELEERRRALDALERRYGGRR